MLYNEATRNENPNAPLSFSDKDIQKFRDGSDPIGHPDTDWYNAVMKKRALETQHNVSISGGSESTTYMASLAYLFQDGLSQEKSYDRYNGCINLDSKINKWVSVGLNASVYRGTDRDEFVFFKE